MYRKQYHIHFVGIGGIGMSGIAELLLNLKYKVSGSDLNSSDLTLRLEKFGAKIYKGHKSDQISGADVVVISSAVPLENPEIIKAQTASIPVISRAEMLAELMRLKYSIAIAGAHGKTSTTSIVASILGHGGLDPTVVIGGKLKSVGTNAFLGQGDFIVAEADESDGSFLKFSPTIAVVTNIDLEHLDFYTDLDAIKKAFLQFLDRIPFYGLAIMCLDSEANQDLIPYLKKRFTTYGFTSQADFHAEDVVYRGLKSHFLVYHGKKRLGEIALNLPGRHNIHNALAGIAVGMELGIEFDIIKASLEADQGVERRMEIKGEVQGIIVVDDYGHHPTEIKTTLEAVKTSWPDRRVVVVFQPHRYTRTKALMIEFSRSFYQSDLLFVLPIYAASERPIEGIDHLRLAEEIRLHGHKEVHCVSDFNAVRAELKALLRSGDLLITLGAGDVWKVGEKMLEDLN